MKSVVHVLEEEVKDTACREGKEMLRNRICSEMPLEKPLSTNHPQLHTLGTETKTAKRNRKIILTWCGDLLEKILTTCHNFITLPQRKYRNFSKKVKNLKLKNNIQEISNFKTGAELRKQKTSRFIWILEPTEKSSCSSLFVTQPWLTCTI